VTSIDPNEVHNAFTVCHVWEKGKLPDGQPPQGAVLAEGITATFAFNRERLEMRRKQVSEWLSCLPDKFHANSGGGWSFLNACVTKDGQQWTGLHRSMEELFCLGIGLGLVRCLVPRNMWTVFPGGMPYYVIEQGVD
jgi:hypothetical protein